MIKTGIDDSFSQRRGATAPWRGLLCGVVLGIGVACGGGEVIAGPGGASGEGEAAAVASSPDAIAAREHTRPVASAAAAAVGPTATPARSRSEWIDAAGTGTLLLTSLATPAASSDGKAPTRTDEIVLGPLLDTEFDVAVTGVIARAVVSQRFRNPTDGWVEGLYVFPLPDDAAVDHMRIRSGRHVIEGRIEEKAEARRVYVEARDDGRRAGLVEQHRPNVFTTSIANIEPGGEIEVAIEYQQLVRRDREGFSLRIPTVVAPRFETTHDGSDAASVPASPLRTSAMSEAESRAVDAGLDCGGPCPVNPVQIYVDLAPGFVPDALRSPHHAIDVERDGDRWLVALAEGVAPADRDFELRWAPAPGDAPGATLFTEVHEDETYALLLVTPPVAAEPPATHRPREVVWVVDVSGSMHGEPLAQARAAVDDALDRLRPGDRFNVIAFSDEAEAVFEDSRDVHADSIRAARRFVGSLESQGGTNIRGALALALPDGAPQRALLRQVVFLTDGAVGDERALFEEIRARLGEARLFTVGIGAAPNSWFMRKAAEAGRGSFTHIGDTNEVASRMAALFHVLESVRVTDIELALPGAAVLRPETIPDLYAGEPIVVAAKLDHDFDWARLRGQTGDALWDLDVGRDAVEDRPGIHALWARREIEALSDARSGARDEAEQSALRDAIVTVAREHHLVSAYTSLVAVDVTPERYAHEALATARLALNVPAGARGDLYGFAQGATPATWYLVAGTVFLVLARVARGRGLGAGARERGRA